MRYLQSVAPNTPTEVGVAMAIAAKPTHVEWQLQAQGIRMYVWQDMRWHNLHTAIFFHQFSLAMCVCVRCSRNCELYVCGMLWHMWHHNLINTRFVLWHLQLITEWLKFSAVYICVELSIKARAFPMFDGINWI